MSGNDDFKQTLMTDAQSSLECVNSVIWPENFQCTFPSIHETTNLIQQVKGVGNWKVTDDSLNPYVSNSSGQIFWLPERGTTSCYRMGFVKRGSVVTSRVTGWFGSGSTALPGMFYQNFLSFLDITALTFSKELALPYNDVLGVGNLLTFSPSIAANYSIAKMLSAVVCLNSAAISATSTIITGRGTAGVVADTRDSAQVGDQAFEQSVLATQSVTSKDGMATFSLPSGIVSIMGPDVAAAFSPPQHDNLILVQGEVEYLPQPDVSFLTGSYGVSGQAFNGAVGLTNNVGGVEVAADYFLTSWGVVPSGTSGNGVPIKVINLPPVDECGCVNLLVHATPTINDPTPLAAPPAAGHDPRLVQFGCLFTAYFAVAQDQGGVVDNVTIRQWVQDSGASTIVINNVNSGSTVYSNYTPASFEFNINAYMRQFEYTQIGKFIGARVQLYYKLDAAFAGTPNPSIRVAVSDIQIGVVAPTVGTPGWVGPAHILQWREVSIGQELAAATHFNVQAVPTGNIAQFTKASVASTLRSANMSVITLIAYLFDSPFSKLRRNWTKEEYLEFKRKYMGSLTARDIVDWANGDPSITAAVAASGVNAGFFDDLFGGIKSVASGVANFVGNAASTIGHVAEVAAPMAMMLADGKVGGRDLATATLRQLPPGARIRQRE